MLSQLREQLISFYSRSKKRIKLIYIYKEIVILFNTNEFKTRNNKKNFNMSWQSLYYNIYSSWTLKI